MDATAKRARYAAVILAAGYSSRMGAFKPLLKLGGKPAVRILIDTAREAGLDPVVVITGHGREQLEAALYKIEQQDAAVHVLYNESYDEGMFSSICKGLSSLQAMAEAGAEASGESPAGCFVLPVDCPLTGEETLTAMIDAMEAAGRRGDFAVPTYEGKKGHPLYVPAGRWAEILADDGAGGLNTITYRYQETMLRVPVAREGAVMDMDTWEDYEALQAYLTHGSGPSLQELAAGRRFFLVRHGQIRQHAEPIFLGRTDVPLSEEGEKQAALAAEQLQREDLQAACVYTSPLLRAARTADAIAEKTGLPVTAEPGFAEMSLGPWDGKPIRQIREESPEAYEARGRDLFAFKTGRGSESFYDLQYRVVRAMKEILWKDPSRDLLIVAHKGTLRVLENNILDKRVEDSWESLSPGEFRCIEP